MYNNSRRGEALVDVVIGAALIGWFAVTMYGAVISLVKQSGAGAKRIQGVWIANSYMEELLGLPFPDPEGDEDDDQYDNLEDFSGYDQANADDYGFRVQTQIQNVDVDLNTYEIVPPSNSEDEPPQGARFTRITVMVTEGGLNEELKLQTLTLGAAEEPPALEIGTVQLGNLVEPADWLIMDYRFQSSGGRDLDTRTEITYPYASKALGWAQNGRYGSGHFRHGGDNTGYGYESVIIDVKELRRLYPGTTRVDVKCSAAWYGRCVSGDVNLTIYAFAGGTSRKQGRYQWQIQNYTAASGEIVFDTNTKKGRRNRVSGATGGNAGTSCDLLADITYDWDAGTLRCLLPGLTAEGERIPCPNDAL